MLYLDNNATTFMPPAVKSAMIDWCNKGNPSSGHRAAKEAKKMMCDFREYIEKLCKFDHRAYKIVFTSGASEANCMIFHCVVQAHTQAAKAIPHVVVSSIEHKSILNMAQSYEARGLVTVSYISPTAGGHILPEDVEKAIRRDTCLVCVMHANNETGAINNIRSIGALSHNHNVPFHCDTSQTFGKFPVAPVADHVDSFCISFHKLYGPPGIGALVIKRELIEGYNLSPYIFGTQNDGLRGGTENLPGIGASFVATRYTMLDRLQKNARMMALKRQLVHSLASHYPTQLYSSYVGGTPKSSPISIVLLSGLGDCYLPNTVLLSVVKKTRPLVCNSQLRADLEKRGIIISIGSACNTSSPKASHVLYAMGADEYIRKGALRITLGDDTTAADIDRFTVAFLELLSGLR